MPHQDTWSRKRVLVTGATGLLGSHLAKQLVAQGAEVIALVRDQTPHSLFFSSSDSWNLSKKLVRVHGEIEDYWLISRIMSDYQIEVVFHLAAQTIVGCANQNPIPTFKTNIEGTWNLLESCRQNQKSLKLVVIASSDKAYGNMLGKSYDESSPLRGDHPYDVSKSCADLLARSYGMTYNLPVVITRCGNLFGPGDLNYSRLIPGIIRDVILNRRPIIRSDGNSIRDFLYVEDGVHAYLTLASNFLQGNGVANSVPLAGEAFNFSYGHPLSVIKILEKILECMNASHLRPQILDNAENEIPIQFLNIEKAIQFLKWKPKFGFDIGLKNTIDWYQQEINSSSSLLGQTNEL